MPNYSAPNSDWFIKNNLTPPRVEQHGTEEEIREKLVELRPKQWRQEGNKLIGITDWGEVVNYLPTNVMLQGTDKDGNPIFTKI